MALTAPISLDSWLADTTASLGRILSVDDRLEARLAANDDHLALRDRVFAGLVDSARVDADDRPDQHQATVQRIASRLAA